MTRERDLLINVLTNALRHAEDLELAERKPADNFSDPEYAVVCELIEAGMIAGEFDRDNRYAFVERITLSGRLFRDDLIAKREAKRWPALLKKLGLILLGAIGALLMTCAKAFVEHFAK